MLATLHLEHVEASKFWQSVVAAVAVVVVEVVVVVLLAVAAMVPTSRRAAIRVYRHG